MTAALSEAHSPERLADAIVGQATAALGAKTASVMLVAEDGATRFVARLPRE